MVRFTPSEYEGYSSLISRLRSESHADSTIAAQVIRSMQRSRIYNLSHGMEPGVPPNRVAKVHLSHVGKLKGRDSRIEGRRTTESGKKPPVGQGQGSNVITCRLYSLTVTFMRMGSSGLSRSSRGKWAIMSIISIPRMISPKIEYRRSRPPLS